MARVIVACAFLGLFTAGAPAVARADTIGDLMRAAEQALATVAQANANAAIELGQAVEVLRRSDVLDDDITAFVKQYRAPSLSARAHREQRRYPAELGLAIDTIKRVANSVLTASSISPVLQHSIVELMQAEDAEGLAWDLDTLKQFERKFGPGSAKLNGVEVLASYLLQRLPAFGVSAAGRPGPLEPVIAYAPSYMSRSAGKTRMIGVTEVGLRRYIFANGWGARTGRFAWLKPAYTSFGVAIAGRSDEPMTAPWQGASRFGAFVGWGAIKVAYLAGDDQRLLVTQQFQLVPWVF